MKPGSGSPWWETAFLPLLASNLMVIKEFLFEAYRKWCECQHHRCSLSLSLCIGTSTEVSNVYRFFMVKKGFDCSSSELKRKCLALLFVSEMSDYFWKAFWEEKQCEYRKWNETIYHLLLLMVIEKKIIFSLACKRWSSSQSWNPPALQTV